MINLSRRVKRAATAVLASAALLGGLTGCTKKQIDPAVVGAWDLPGTEGKIKGFCYGPVLFIYTNNSSEPDEIEYILAGGCFRTDADVYVFDANKLDDWLRGKDTDLAESSGGN